MAKKTKTSWFCNNCGYESPRWEGKCPACGEWNTMVEERVAAVPSSAGSNGPGPGMPGADGRKNEALPVNAIKAEDLPRIKLPSGELNRVLGGGLVPGSLVLIGGEPGIGKSTLVLQNLLSIKSKTILYVSGEESATQLKLRADRIGRGSDNVFIVCETSMERVFNQIEKVKPGILVVDSIQTVATDTLESAAGSVSQIRECAGQLLKFAKMTNVPVLLIGHITKEGSLAGPKVLEHIVDAVLQFEGDSKYLYRILRPIKNRFGSTSELGIYEMQTQGLREVTNPSELLMLQGDSSLSGVAVGVALEGARPFLIETQALVSTAAYGTPQRSVTGFDSKRLNMLLAVLEKRAGFKLGQKDVFLNIAGGLKVNDPTLDLAVLAAVLSSNVDMALPPSLCLAGEVGLTGEIRPVQRPEIRISEAQKLGMEEIVIPRGNLKGTDHKNFKINIFKASKVEDVFRHLWG